MPALVYLWTASLDRTTAEYAHFRGLLSEEERGRADRFLRDEARRRFTASRGLLRTILGRFLSLPPESLDIGYGYNGKPELALEKDFQFNVSHSADQWRLAATYGRRLGVDIERIRPDFATMPIARRFFSPCEVADLSDVPDFDRASAFFRCWTRKEAFIKALGAGLGFPLDEFDVSLTKGAAGLRSIRGDRDAARKWSLIDLPAEPGFAAALAVESEAVELHRQHAV